MAISPSFLAQAFANGLRIGSNIAFAQQKLALAERQQEFKEKAWATETQLQQERLELEKQRQEIQNKLGQIRADILELQRQQIQDRLKKLPEIAQHYENALTQLGFPKPLAHELGALAVIEPKLSAGILNYYLNKKLQSHNRYQPARTVIAVDPATKKTVILPFVVDKETGRLIVEPQVFDYQLPSVFLGSVGTQGNKPQTPFVMKIRDVTGADTGLLTIYPDGSMFLTNLETGETRPFDPKNKKDQQVLQQAVKNAHEEEKSWWSKVLDFFGLSGGQNTNNPVPETDSDSDFLLTK